MKQSLIRKSDLSGLQVFSKYHWQRKTISIFNYLGYSFSILFFCWYFFSFSFSIFFSLRCCRKVYRWRREAETKRERVREREKANGEKKTWCYTWVVTTQRQWKKYCTVNRKGIWDSIWNFVVDNCFSHVLETKTNHKFDAFSFGRFQSFWPSREKMSDRKTSSKKRL